MRENESDKQHPCSELDLHYQSILVPTDIKHYALSDKVRVWKAGLYLREVVPRGSFRLHIPAVESAA